MSTTPRGVGDDARLPRPGRGRLMRSVTALDWASSRMGDFAGRAGQTWGRRFASYDELWSWSVHEPEQFWSSIIDFFEIEVTDRPARILEGVLPEARWMSGARLNYAQHMLRFSGASPALIGVSQTRGDVTLTRDELRERVAECAAGLRRLGVGAGDAVAAYMPNIPEAVVLLLATASLGAVFASCPPEFGVRAVVDRLDLVQPRVLVASDGYMYGTRRLDRMETI